MPWEIAGQIGSHSRSGVDGSGWLWELHRNGESAHVLVEVSGTAHAVDRAGLPPETREALETEGRSVIETLVARDELPRVVQCGTIGCRELATEEVRGQN